MAFNNKLVSLLLTSTLMLTIAENQLAKAAEVNTIKILKSEPASGKLPFGVKVLVDDGTCPPGRIKQISRSSENEPRKKQCVVWRAGKSGRLLRKEPGRGLVPPGARVLVDDGTCPSGKIKQITGGGKGHRRKYECIASP